MTIMNTNALLASDMNTGVLCICAAYEMQYADYGLKMSNL